jgi:hypothetical protein
MNRLVTTVSAGSLFSQGVGITSYWYQSALRMYRPLLES